MASLLQWLPHVWPHPVHCTLTAGSSSSSGSVPGAKPVLEPIRPKGASDSDRRKDVLETILQEVASSNIEAASQRQTTPLPSGYRVCLSDTELLIKGSKDEVRSVPLLLTDIVGAALPRGHGADYAVALAPRHEVPGSSQSSPQSQPEVQPQPELQLGFAWCFFNIRFYKAFSGPIRPYNAL